MREKRTFYAEAAYFAGLLALAFGTALMERADFGMSMVVAPAYLLHLKISQTVPAYSFGMSEYVFQAALLVVISIVMKGFKKGYLFSFVTAVLYGSALDNCMSLVSRMAAEGLLWRWALYVSGMLICALGIAFLFRTYIAPEAYELFVKELAARYGWPISRVKTVYDCCSCLAGVALSFAFFGFGRFEGVKWGTILCALVNGWLIGRMSAGLDAAFVFRDALKLRGFFEQ